MSRSNRVLPHVSFVDGCEDEPARTIKADAAMQNEHVR